MDGGAEYEKIQETPGIAMGFVTALSFGHFLALFLIIVAIGIFFIGRLRRHSR